MISNIGYGSHGEQSLDSIPSENLEEQRLAEEASKDANRIDIPEWIKLVFDKVDGENSEEELRRVRKQTKIHRFYRGEQRGFWSNRTGDWVSINPEDFAPRDAAVLLVNNQFRPMVKSLSKEWARSRTNLKAIPRSKDTAKARGAARYATSLLDLYQKKLIGERFRQAEAKYAMLSGNYFRYTYHDKSKKSKKISKPVMGNKKFAETDQEFWWCPMCDAEGDMDMLKADSCPECKSPTVQKDKLKSRPTAGATTITKYDSASIGDLVTELVDPREVKVHLRARNIAQTPYLRRKRFIMVQLLKYLFPWAHIKPMSASPVQHYIQETELSVGSSNGRIASSDYETYAKGLGSMTEFSQLWLRPSMYYNIEAKFTFQVGRPGKKTTINIGDKLIERFPNGLYISMSGEAILEMKDEVIDEFWAHGGYDELTDSFWADGLDDLIDQQSFLNEMQALYIENIIYNASPKIIFNPYLIEASMFANRPSEMTPMSKSARRDDKARDAVYPIQGMNISADVPAAMSQSVDNMRVMSGAHLAMSGANDPRLNTATSMAIARDASIAQLGPALASKAEVEVEWAYQVLLSKQKHWVDEVDNDLLGKYSVQEAQYFRDCDLDDDIEIIAEPGSWVPRTDGEVRADFLTFLTAGGIPLGFANPQVPQEIRDEAARLFRMPIDLSKIQPDIRNAEIRLEQITAMADALIRSGVVGNEDEDVDVANIIFNEVPVDVWIDDHGVFIQSYTSWKKTDQGRLAPRISQMVIDLLIIEHTKATETLQDYQFSQQAKYQVAAQAMGGMLQNQQADAQSVRNVAEQDALAQSQAAQQPQMQTQPLPSNTELPGAELADRATSE